MKKIISTVITLFFCVGLIFFNGYGELKAETLVPEVNQINSSNLVTKETEAISSTENTKTELKEELASKDSKGEVKKKHKEKHGRKQEK
jgi:hypothetical protein